VAEAQAADNATVDVTNPVIVVGSAFSGAAALRQALISREEVAWIDAPGLVHIGQQVGRVWARVDGRGDHVPSFAWSSIGKLLQSMILGRVAVEGVRTWAAMTAPSPREGLDFFARMFPTARFVCIHRRADDVIASVVGANRWGFTNNGHGFDRFIMMYPWSPGAAIGEYWVSQTTVLTGFEAAHSSRCLRVRYEDITARPAEVAAELGDFADQFRHIDLAEAVASTRKGIGEVGEEPVPPERIPPDLVSRMNHLLAMLEYPLLHTEVR
jgi:hypothetical protein